jgi:sec-independent protein translocase protein TatB
MFPEGRILDFVIVGVIALIVVGPKDLPLLMRKAGQFTARMRAMAAEFRASFDEMARQSELDELRKEVEAMRAGTPLHAAAGFDAGGEASKVFDDIHAGLRSNEVQLPLATHETAATEASEPELDFSAPPSSPAIPTDAPEDLSPAKAAS